MMKNAVYDLASVSRKKASPVKSLLLDLDFFLRSYSAALKNPVPQPKKVNSKHW